jgi:hypothetical protein
MYLIIGRQKPAFHKGDKMDRIFDGCVDLLENISQKTGLTYKQINVIIFCIGWPAFTLWLALKAFKNNY